MSNQVKIVGPGLEGTITAALLANISSSNNPLLHKMIMETSRPNFLGTAEDFPDFKRQWGEYHNMLKATFPCVQEGQLLQIF